MVRNCSPRHQTKRYASHGAPGGAGRITSAPEACPSRVAADGAATRGYSPSLRSMRRAASTRPHSPGITGGMIILNKHKTFINGVQSGRVITQCVPSPAVRAAAARGKRSRNGACPETTRRSSTLREISPRYRCAEEISPRYRRDMSTCDQTLDYTLDYG